MAAAILVALFFAVFMPAQTVSPVISEYTSKVAKGRIELINPGIIPLTVIMEPKSFTVSETGAISYGPLDKGIHVKLSAMSFQIQPQQSYYLFYEAQADSVPAWFVLYANIGGYHKNSNGMNIRLDLPHTVYILPKQSATKADIAIKFLGLSADKAHLRFSVTNSGSLFGRAMATELKNKSGTTEGNGFPMFPHYTRIVEMACKGDQSGSVFGLRMKGLKVEEPPSDPAESRACTP
jgi:hypothetical protein